MIYSLVVLSEFRRKTGVGMNNEVLDETFQPQTHGTDRCNQQLGGIIKAYYRYAT